ncbi:MAG: PQQ-binding-like beta-propeller repeat protein [Alphaproteobacteria bacterium]|nr:PQQ-binding-like beta-propeller repeat protein [Alphaproteobacteria bacterium]
MIGALLALILAASAGTGFRGDGTGVAEGPLPATWAPAWRTDLAAWGNASPVRLADLVCVTEEPLTLVCLDAASGAVRWRAVHEVLPTLPADERAALAPRLASARELEAEERRLLPERSALLRAARAGDPAARAEVDRLSARLETLRAELDGLAWARTAADRDIIGYATPTPVADDRTLYAIFGNGVVAAHAPDGTTRWTRWLGAAPKGMRGYDLGTAASPLLVDGTLVVAHDALLGLDPATGTERWRVPDYRDFGTPAVARVGGAAILALPDGRLVRPADGEVLAEGLADPWYVGPHADGDVVVWIGGHAAVDNLQAGSVPAVARRLAPGGTGVDAPLLWKADLPTADLYYTPPVSRDGRLYSVSRSGELRVLDLATGAILHSQDLLPDLGAFVYASPTLVGDRLLVLSERGVLLLLDAAPPFAIVGREEVQGQHRATPLVTSRGTFLRPLEAVVRVGGTP